MIEIDILGEGKTSRVIKLGNKVLKILKKKINDNELRKSSKRELNCHFQILKYLKENPNIPIKLYKNILVLDGYFGIHLKKESDRLRSRKNLQLVIGDNINFVRESLDQDFEKLEIFYFNYYKCLTLSNYINDLNGKKKELFLDTLPYSCKKIDNLRITLDILQGLGFLHSLSISHHDLKIENILLVNDNNEVYAKIIDLGLGSHKKHLSNNNSYVTCGTISYMSPEKLKLYSLSSDKFNLNSEKYNSYCYDAYKSDIWSVGIILYLLCNLNFPFDKAHKTDPKYKQFLSNNYYFDNMEKYQNKILSLSCINGLYFKKLDSIPISLMLQEDVKKRYNINDIIHLINFIVDLKNEQNSPKSIPKKEEFTPDKNIIKKRSMVFDDYVLSKKITRDIVF